MRPALALPPSRRLYGPARARLRAVALSAVVAALALTGCGRKESAPAPATPAPAAPVTAETDGAKHLPPGIDWFAGDVDAAFASAKSSGKPLFLYWGAEWCPPCAQIKATIFNKREFQERSRLFIPVYLDGDTPSAQLHGERFGVVGYPTMILFRADGAEITRLPGTVDIARYASILDVALAGAKPVAEIVATAASGGEVTPDDWRLLAYYSWSTDNGRVLPQDQRVATFRRLSSRCPLELEPECARLYFEYLGAAAETSGDDQKVLTGLDRAEARGKLLALLGKPSVGRANVENLFYGPKDVVPLLSDAGTPERRQLTDAWRAALDRLSSGAEAAALSAPEQLNIVRARVVLARLDAPDAPLPPALLDEARQSVARIDAATTDPNARQAAINAAANLYWEAGLDADANRMLVAELEKSKSPYYFMLDLADLAQKAGREAEAVDWLERAYAGAKGPATRFQWGYSYMVGLLEMTPEDAARIERVGLEMLGELGESPDAFYQRTQMRLDQLSGLLLEWEAGNDGAGPARDTSAGADQSVADGSGNDRTAVTRDAADRAAVVARLRERAGEICRGLPAEDEGRRNCERFLEPKKKASVGA